MMMMKWDDFREAIFAFVTYVVLHIWEWEEVFMRKCVRKSYLKDISNKNGNHIKHDQGDDNDLEL
jgi:hypothetical protein